MTVYRGRRAGGDTFIMKDDKKLPLAPSLELCNHSPTGFNWGYGGSGPAQLALALLLDVTKDAELSSRLHQDFKWAYVSRWGEMWEISSNEIKEWIRLDGDQRCRLGDCHG